MTQPDQSDLIAVNIDGREIAVPTGTNVIEAARLLGTDIPHFCYHSKLSVVGNCRMCLVETGKPAVDAATKQPILDPATGRQVQQFMNQYGLILLIAVVFFAGQIIVPILVPVANFLIGVPGYLGT